MNFFNRRNNILHYFLILLFIHKLNFSRFENFIIYYNNVILLNKILRLVLIIIKKIIIAISYNHLIKKVTL